MINHIHHIGIAVKNLEEGLRFWQDKLGLGPVSRVSWPGLEGATMDIDGVLIELIEPRQAILPVAQSLLKIVAEHDCGVHHLCVEVDDIDAELKKLKEAGVKLLDEVPQQNPGGRIAWLDEQAFDGLMIELCEKGYKVG